MNDQLIVKLTPTTMQQASINHKVVTCIDEMTRMLQDKDVTKLLEDVQALLDEATKGNESIAGLMEAIEQRESPR